MVTLRPRPSMYDARHSSRLRSLLFRPDRAAVERSIVMSVSVCVCVCPRSYVRNYTSDLNQWFVHVTYGCG